MLKHSLLLAWRGLGRMTRLTLELLLLLFFAGAALVLVLRHSILPDIERYHDKITLAAIMAVGQPMTIGKIEADWDGLRPRLLFTDVKILDKEGKVALHLPRIENTVAWTSLPMFELRFHSLLIDSPDLAVRRDAAGRWYVAGIPLDDRSSEGGDSADWLLHQSSIVIRNGRIVWQDELRAAPLLELNAVDLSIENKRGRHRFSLRASPPEKLASRLDVRGNLSGDSFADMSDWRGQLYAQIEYADVLAWRAWVTLPKIFKRGQGALRLWLGVDGGQIRSLDADVALASVRARLAEELPQLDLSELRGRIGWRTTERGFEVSTRRLALQMREGFNLKPTDFFLRLSNDGKGGYAAGEVRANQLELSDLARLSTYLPLGQEIKQQLAEAAPQGRISALEMQWRNRADETLRFDIAGRFDGLAMRRVGERPGFSGLSGEVEGGDNSGTVKLDSRKFKLDAPQLFPEPVTFDTLTAQLGWQRSARGLEFKLGNVEIANADLAGTIYGTYQTVADGPGIVDATVDMSRVAVKMTGRYTPVPAVNQETRDWLQAALQGGQADRFRVRLRGDLRDFPFVNNERGLFRLEAHAKGVVMEFVKGWPKLEDADTRLLIEGKTLGIEAVRATTAGARLQNVKVNIPDLLVAAPLLLVRGEAVDTTQHCLDYILKSPVNGYLDGFTESIQARGDGRLNLQLDIPLAGEAAIKVRGDYRFVNNEVDLGENIPLLRNVNGVLLFTESSLNAGDITAQVLGGPARLAITSEQGGLVTKARGRLDLDNLNKLQPHPLWGRVHGNTEWSTDIRVKNKLADVTVDADLLGIVSDLPAPLGKRASERMSLHFVQKSLDRRKDRFDLRLGSLLDASVIRQLEAGGWVPRSGRVAFGGETVHDSKDGIWVRGRIPALALEGWGGLGLGGGEMGTLPNIAGIDLKVDKLAGFGSTVQTLDIKGSARNGLLSLKLAARELNGDLIWQPQGNGKLLGRFRHLMLGEGVAPPLRTANAPATGARTTANNDKFPDVDISIDKLSYKGRQLGRLEMALLPSGGDVLLDHLLLTNPDGVLNMSGKWQSSPERTQVKLQLDITDAGRILARSGLPDSLKDGNGTLVSDLYWSGGPDAFALARLNGTLNLKVGKGRFLKVEPGAARLLGVLSLQRLTLGYTDVFSKGFEFDSITGSAQIVNGLLLTNDMKLNGAVAKVTMNGQVDLNRETQNLKIRILPTVGDNLSVLSFAAGPVVGVGVLLANRILSNPLDKLAAIEYNVSGSWADPKVEKVGETKASQTGTPAE
jgi:uncharacterized protein (TIGR02099 family)